MNALKSALSNGYLVLLARLILGVVFLVAAIDKISDPASFAASIDNYKIFPHSISLVLATLLPWLELLCAFALFFGIAVHGSALLTCAMLTLFTVAVISGLLRGLDISCGCFTQDPSVQKIGWTKVSENLGMIALSMYLLFSEGMRFSLEQYYRGGTHILAVLLCGALAVLSG
jgi:uncharacterized membrane protein YphA (DoxX/SURF4 family)